MSTTVPRHHQIQKSMPGSIQPMKFYDIHHHLETASIANKKNVTNIEDQCLTKLCHITSRRNQEIKKPQKQDLKTWNQNKVSWGNREGRSCLFEFEE